MRFGEVAHVNVIPNAGAIGRGMFGPENGKGFASAKGGLQDARDEMGFGVMMLAEFCSGTGGVEIAEDYGFGVGLFRVPFQHLLKHSLGFTVGIDRPLRGGLGDGDGFGDAVGGAGGTENKFAHAKLRRAMQEVECVGGVVLKILERALHRFTHQRAASKMQNGFWLRLLEHRTQGGEIANIRLMKSCFGCHSGTMAEGKIVHHRDSVPLRQQMLHADTANITRAAGD